MYEPSYSTPYAAFTDAALPPDSIRPAARKPARWSGWGLGLTLAATLLNPSAFAAGNAPLAGQDASRKLRVESPALARQLQQQGARLIADYGSFQLFATTTAIGAPLAAGGGAAWADEFDVIELNTGPLRTTLPAVQSLRQPLPPFTGKRLHLIQFAGPVKPEWHHQLAQNGAQIVTYLPHNAYVIYGDAATLGPIQAWAGSTPEIQWEGAFGTDFKIHPDARLTDAKGQPRTLSDDLFSIQLVADDAANAATLEAIEALKLAPVVKQERVLNYLNVVVRLPAEKLPSLAARGDVVSIWLEILPRQRDERQNQIIAGNLTGTGPTGPGYLAWLASKGFTQEQFALSGFVVDVSDSGIDNGTIYPAHFGLYPAGDLNLPSRVAYNRLLGTPHTGSTIQGCDGHGNLNSHIIAGYNDYPGFPFKDAAGFSYGLGVAPFVRVGSSVIFDPSTFTSPNLPDLQSQAYADGARISANSWGANTAGGYNANAQAYDALVRDAQPAGATVPGDGNQEMVIVFAAGNAGPTAGSVGAPGTAKNVISVGATENVHSHSIANGGNTAAGSDGCDEPDTSADSANDIAGFSSRGPCADGRAKPDIVAPGTHITGGVAQQASPGPTGTALSCFAGAGVCALPGSGTAGTNANFFPIGQQFYTTSSGTSHSTPAVAGAAALLRQWFINLSSNPPSPALTKAYLVNSARYLNGSGANDTLPSRNQGMGDLNLGTAFDGTPRIVSDQSALEKFTASGQTRSYTGRILNTNLPLRVTLAWTDAPGSTSGNAYNNNLDLVLTVGGQTYRGNVFSGATSIPGGSADPRNNVESVFLPPGLEGNFIITITAANINSDGVPNDADFLDQDFALVVYNAETREAPVLESGTVTFTAEDCSPGNGAADPGETVTVQLSLLNVGSAPTTNLVATLLATSSVLTPSAPQSYGAIVNGGAGVAQPFTFQAVGPCGSLIFASLQLTDGGVDLGTVTFPLRLGVLNATNYSYAQPAAMTIPTNIATATPYPTTIEVSGLSGTLSNVVVSVKSFSHTYPSDVDCLLVGPTGQTVLLLSNTGGSADAVGADLTFDDAASGNVPSPIVSGTYRPTSSGTITLPAPAPARPYGTALSAFAGTDPNGTWRLYVYDHANEDGGSIDGGWTLDLTMSSGGCCTSSSQIDLALTANDSPDPVALYNDLIYTVGVTNLSIATANAVVLTSTLPAGVAFVSATTSLGTISNDTGKVIAALGSLAPGAGANVSIVVNVLALGTLTNHVTVASSTFDVNAGNNAATLITSVLTPVLSLTPSYAVIGESCTPPNGVLDPGETVTLAVALANTGTARTTNLVVTLQPTGGITSPSGPKNYGGILPGSAPVTNTFTFTAQGTCGGTVTATLDITDNGTPLTILSNIFRIGVPIAMLQESFDGVAAPALPSGWTTAITGTTTAWLTTTAAADTAPNAAFASDPSTTTENQLISPPVVVTTDSARLTFRHSYNTESCCDGGRLDISIAGGAYVDIVSAGGSFISGGYGSGNWWAGNSGGFLTTVVSLPASTLGQTVRLRWRFNSDSSVAGVGWYVDSVSLIGGYVCCVANDIAVTTTDAPDPVLVTQNVTYTIGVTNSGPANASGVVLTNILPASASFISAAASQGTWSQAGNVVVANLGNLSPGVIAGVSIVARAEAPGTLTNVAIVRRDGTEVDLSNNSAITLTTATLPDTSFYAFAPGAMPIPSSGNATPYPSVLNVSGIPGTVTKVTVTLSNLNHTWPDDLDILLVSPGGQKVILMSDAGSSLDLINLNLTFDDAAAGTVPDASQIVSGTYRPADYSTVGESLPSPAPTAPYSLSLAVFNGVDPNGQWKLYINDDTSGDSGNLTGGWRLRFTVDLPPPVLLGVAASGTNAFVQFPTDSGHFYTLQFKDSLTDTSWQTLTTILGDGAVHSIPHPPAGHDQRFYRLKRD